MYTGFTFDGYKRHKNIIVKFEYALTLPAIKRHRANNELIIIARYISNSILPKRACTIPTNPDYCERQTTVTCRNAIWKEVNNVSRRVADERRECGDTDNDNR